MVQDRWENSESYVEIESAFSADHCDSVFIVNSNAFHPKHLPLSWRRKFLQSDENAVNDLYKSVSNWAQENRYSRTIDRHITHT